MKAYAPGPKGHFPFGCFKSFRDTPLELLLSCQQQYGDVVKLPVGPGVSFCLVYAPDDFDKVFGDACFGRSDLAAEFEPLAGGSMIIADGDTWRSQRKAVVPSFSIRRLREMSAQVDRLAADVVASWRKKIAADGAIDLQQECVSYAMQVLSEFLFGKQISNEQVDRIAQWWNVSLHHMNIRLSQPVPLPQWLPTPNTIKLNHAANHIATVLLEIIEQHQRDPELANGGFLSDLLRYRDEQTGTKLSQQHILKEIIGVFLAGFDTVASGMMWTFYYLAQHPKWQHALRDEL
jgi:cytochrome P450